MDDMPMGLPVTSILAEIFLQEIENRYCPNIIKNRHILFIARYMNDILIIFDVGSIMAESISEDHSAMYQKLKYKMETETNQ
jgi:hypothetical protein